MALKIKCKIYDYNFLLILKKISDVGGKADMDLLLKYNTRSLE